MKQNSNLWAISALTLYHTHPSSTTKQQSIDFNLPRTTFGLLYYTREQWTTSEVIMHDRKSQLTTALGKLIG